MGHVGTNQGVDHGGQVRHQEGTEEPKNHAYHGGAPSPFGV
jgi:hypothetical protein